MWENYDVPNIEGLDTLPAHVRDLFYEDPHAQDEYGNTVIHRHIIRGEYYPIMTPKLIGKATDLEFKNNNGFTAFLVAITCSKKFMIQALIESGANVHTTDKFACNALHYIALMPLTDIDTRRNRPLSLIPLSCILPFFESILQKGVDVNLQNRGGSTPLMFAAFAHNLEIVKLLLKYGANVHLTNLISQTGLHMASLSLEWHGRNFDTITELIRNGACVNCFDDRGRTPLGCILLSGHRNKTYFARKFLTAACLAHWEIRKDFYILQNRILGELKADDSLVEHVNACYEEIGRKRSFQLSERFNLCHFALRGVSDAEESVASEIKDAALNILVRKTFPIYNDFLFSNFQLDYLRQKLRELEIFTYRTGQKISLIPDVNSHIASFLDINGLLLAFKAFSRETC